MAATTKAKSPKRHKTGREQRRKTKTAKSREVDLSRFYQYRLPSINPGEFEFLLDLLRPKLPPLSLDKLVDTFGWVDEQATLTGSLTAHRPDPEDPSSLPITRGHLVRCRTRWEGGTYQLWTMRCEAPQIEVDTGQVTISLQDDMAMLDAGGLDWWFRKTKHRKHGFSADEIAREVARRLGLRAGKIAEGKARFELKMRNATGLAVLRRAYANERDHNGRAFILRIRDGRLEVVPVARNPLLYVLSEQIQTALITQKAGSKVPTTVLTGRGRIGKGKHTKSITFTEHDRKIVRQFGYVPDTIDVGAVASHRELRDAVKRELANRLRLSDTVTVQHQGIPFIVRGDATKVDLPLEGYKGKDAYVFCTRATHTVAAGTYQSQWDFTRQDAFLQQIAAADKAAQQRAKKSAQRGRSNLSGQGGWITVKGTFFGVADSGGAPACGGDFSYNGGMLYAELGFSGGAGSKLGPLFGMAQLPCGFALEIRNPANGRTAVAKKRDTGGGAPGARIDLWHVVADLIGFTSIGFGDLQIRRAA